MSKYSFIHDTRRYLRKCRHWGLHGRHANDRIMWDLNHGFRRLDMHYYYGRGEHAERKWRALHDKYTARRMEVTA